MTGYLNTFIIFLTAILPHNRYAILTPNVQQSIHAKPLNQLNKDESGQFKIVIDPGHGGKDQGCAHTSVIEKDITLLVALKIGAKIKESRPDVNIVYTRSADQNISLKKRIQLSHKADLFISIHANAVDDHTVQGFETYVYGVSPNENESTSYSAYVEPMGSQKDFLDDIISDIMHASINEASYQLGFSINKFLYKENRINNRGLRQASFRVLAKTKAPSVLLELGYLTNKNEAKLLASNSHQELLAQCISKGIIEYLALSTAAD